MKTENSAFHQIIRAAERVAQTDSTILILGETGSGKEVLANYIHQQSLRSEKPFIPVNCAALPDNLMESEMFGHEKGSFTGANEQRMGRFEMAQGGTLFLDEIGDLPEPLQIKLLRALQERRIERVGGRHSISLDVRIMAATHQDLGKLIRDRKFRKDLYYRLNVFPLRIPPLRERKEDIRALTEGFIHKHRDRLNAEAETIDSESLKLLQAHSWPGNVRELENVVERSLILSSGHYLNVDRSFLEQHLPVSENRSSNSNSTTLKEMEREAIQEAIQKCNGIVEGSRGAAKQLGIPPSTLRDRLKEFGINKAGAL